MSNTMKWLGAGLVLLAFLPAIGMSFGVLPVFSGIVLVAIAIAGGLLFRAGKFSFSHGWMFWLGLVLALLALLPAIGLVVSPALVFTGPLLVVIAAGGGFLLASPRRGR